MTMTDYNSHNVKYMYEWDGEAAIGSLRIPKQDIGKNDIVEQLVSRKIAEELRQFGKVIVLDGRVVLGNSTPVQRIESTRKDMTVVTEDGTNIQFQLSIYDAGSPITPAVDK